MKPSLAKLLIGYIFAFEDPLRNHGKWHDFCIFQVLNLSIVVSAMSRNYPFLLILLGMFLTSSTLKSEGTREIMQNPAHNSRILFDSDFGGFGQYGAQYEDRLHIRIKEPGEMIYYGFGRSIISDFLEGQYAINDVSYRIIDPDGQVVRNTILQPLAGDGYINSYLQAISGPVDFDPLGYDPLIITCAKAGDYRIEFTFDGAFNEEFAERRELEYFDITVVDVTGKPVEGRIWSKAWMLTVSEKGGSPYENPFYGKAYILSDDGIVTSVDFNGMRPFVFTMSANATGVSNTGNVVLDRKSVRGKSTYPQYKVFLNDPDSTVFPSGEIGEFATPATLTGDSPPYCINVNTTKAGAVQVLIEMNGIEGYQVNSRDILLAQNVNAGTSCIQWDGKDGLGQTVGRCGGEVKFYVTYAGGLTHMPIYDVETNSNGFIIELVRPKASSSRLALYWDDSNIDGYSVPPSDGCDGSAGCHKFPYFFGDSATINTWWYSISDLVDTLKAFEQGVALNDVIVKNQSCSYKQDGYIEILASTGSQSLQYSIFSNSFRDTSVFNNLSAGSYNVVVKDDRNCTASRQVELGINTIVEADFDIFQAGAYNELEFQFTGEGGHNFDWNFGDGETSDQQDPLHTYNVDTGYYVKLFIDSGAPDYCVDSITKYVEVYPPLQIFAPSAFTPNGDNLNDFFVVRGIAIFSYEIYIFNSWGQQLFYSNNLESSWDGTAFYGPCDRGVYAYVITTTDRNGEVHQLKGTVTLLR